MCFVGMPQGLHPSGARASATSVAGALESFDKRLREVLAKPGWRLRVRDPELRRALGLLSNRVGEVRRFTSQPGTQRANAWVNDELLRLDSIERDDLLRLDSAFALYNRLGQVVMELAPDEYISVRIAGEAPEPERKPMRAGGRQGSTK